MPAQPTKEHPIAYFCAEFAISPDLPIYSGGLGILAADYVLEAAQQQCPLIGIGLWYQQGYFQQTINAEGKQEEHHPLVLPEDHGLTLTKDDQGKPLKIAIPHQDQPIVVQAWQYKRDGVTLYLLDANIAVNPVETRCLTQQLYLAEPSVRLQQELILGVGGVLLLQELGIDPLVYHLNEGHSALAWFALAGQLRGQNFNSQAALQAAKQRIVFTNHTIMPAGNDLFDAAMVRTHLQALADATKIDVTTMLRQAEPKDQLGQFSMTTLAQNGSCRANTVSQRHQQAASEVWPDTQWINITNAVYMPRWIHPRLAELSSGKLLQASDQQLWLTKQEVKRSLCRLIYQMVGFELSEERPLIAWARRFAAYKRPTLILQHPDKLLAVLKYHQAYLIMAGKAHPNDQTAKYLIEEVNTLLADHELGKYVIYLPNYSLDIANDLVAGADVWLNTPIPGKEASGTSGMKAGANGTLLVSTNDGWMSEVDWQDTAWILPDQDAELALYQLLEHELLPLYSLRDQNGLPTQWIKRMRNTIGICQEQFSTERMLKDYLALLYPSAEKENTRQPLAFVSSKSRAPETSE